MSARYSKTSSRGRSIVMVRGDGVHGPRSIYGRARTRRVTVRSCSGECTSSLARRARRGAAGGTARRPSRSRVEVDASRRPAACGGSARSRAARRSGARTLLRSSELARSARSSESGKHGFGASPWGIKPLPNRPSGRDPIDRPVCIPRWRSGRWNGACARQRSRLDGPTLRPATPRPPAPCRSSVRARCRSPTQASTAPPHARHGSRRRARASTAPASTSPRAGRGRASWRPCQPRVDADRPLAGRRHPLRRRDGVAPSCAGRQRGGRRTRARRPLAQRHLRQRPRASSGARSPTATRSRSAATRSTSSTPPPSAPAPRPPAAVAE